MNVKQPKQQKINLANLGLKPTEIAVTGVFSQSHTKRATYLQDIS